MVEKVCIKGKLPSVACIQLNVKKNGTRKSNTATTAISTPSKRVEDKIEQACHHVKTV